MGNIFKHLFWIAPITVIVLYFTLHGREDTKQEIRQDSATFERDWNETKASMSKSPTEKAKFEARAKEAEQGLESIKKDKAVLDAQQKQQLKDVDRAISDIDAELAKGQGRRP